MLRGRKEIVKAGFNVFFSVKNLPTGNINVLNNVKRFNIRQIFSNLETNNPEISKIITSQLLVPPTNLHSR